MKSLVLYLLLFIISTFMLSKSRVGYDRKLDIPFVIAIFLPIMFAALRDNVGTDFISYEVMYKRNAALSFVEWFRTTRTLGANRFLIWLMARAASFFQSRELFLGFFASFTVIPVAYRIKVDYDKSICALTYFVYLTSLYCTGLNICKQIASIGIIFWGIKYINSRKFGKYLFTVLVASLVHITAVISLLAYFLYDPCKGFFTVKRAICILFGLFAISILPKMKNLLGERFGAHLSYSGETNNLTFYVSLLWGCLYCVLFKYYVRFDRKNSTLIMMFVMNLFFSVTGFYSPTLKRIAMFFSCSQPLLMGQLPVLFKEKGEKVAIKIALYFYTTLLFVVQSYIMGQGGLFPYSITGGSI